MKDLRSAPNLPNKNISFKIESELHKQFRLACFTSNTNIKQALLAYIEEFVKGKSPG